MPFSFTTAVKMLYSYILSALFYGINLLLNEDYYSKIAMLKTRIIWKTYIAGVFLLDGFYFVIFLMKTLIYEKNIFHFLYEIIDSKTLLINLIYTTS